MTGVTSDVSRSVPGGVTGGNNAASAGNLSSIIIGAVTGNVVTAVPDHPYRHHAPWSRYDIGPGLGLPPAVSGF